MMIEHGTPGMGLDSAHYGNEKRPLPSTFSTCFLCCSYLFLTQRLIGLWLVFIPCSRENVGDCSQTLVWGA